MMIFSLRGTESTPLGHEFPKYSELLEKKESL